LIAEAPISATSCPVAVVVSVNLPLASVTVDVSPLSSTPLPLASTKTVAFW
jgi:hypothetical protein